jgi:hypothetical protein
VNSTSLESPDELRVSVLTSIYNKVKVIPDMCCKLSYVGELLVRLLPLGTQV